ncbi:MAG: hypothetical protein JNL01_07185 [Bdellovibrionales bacterium]|nr:hypothetical protein [Bdellovibrionales bacterium]
MSLNLVFAVLLGFGFDGSAQAQEAAAQPAEPVPAAPAPVAEQGGSEEPVAPVIKRYREREADGTQAINRFDEKNLVQKSLYKLNGEQLEVDPD